MKISTRIALLVTIVGLLFIGINTFYYFRIGKINNIAKDEIPASVLSIEQTSKLDSEAQLMRYYDEVLTQSARNFAFTGDVKWKKRYDEAAPKLDAVIAHAIESGDSEDKVLFSEIDTVNKSLVVMEQETMGDVAAGHKDQAVKILESESYALNKKQYSDALAQYATKRGTKLDEAITTSGGSVSKISHEINDIISNITYEVLSLIIIFIILIIILYWRTRKTLALPLTILRDNVVAVAAGDYSRTIESKSKDEIGELSQAFNKMTQALRESDLEVKRKVEEQTADIKKKQEMIEDEEEKTSAMLESIGEGVLGVDEEGMIIIINEAAAQMLGYGREELLGKRLAEKIKMLDKDEKKVIDQERPINQVLKSGRKQTYTNYFYQTEEGKNLPIALTIAPIVLNEKIIGAINVFRDISKEKQIDKAKTEFVSLASHQLRTPLSAINWYAEMLINGDSGKLNKDQQKYMKEVYAGNQRMIDLVNALLDVSRLELGTFAINPMETDIPGESKQIIKEIMPLAKKKNIKLCEEYDKAIPKILVDPKLLRIVIQNLVSNAMKYTPEKGKVALTITKKEPNIQIEVADTGYGIPKAQQGEIFQKLFRADNVRAKDTEGTGLGLYIAKSIIDHSGGKIWFDSAENKGTKFYVELPLKGMPKKEGLKTLEDIK